MKKFAVIFLISLLLPQLALADGGLIPPPDYYAYETNQKAVIFYEAGQETLVVSTTFESDAQDFAWIIPTPSQPSVEKSTAELFSSLAKLTQVYNDYDYGLVMPMGGLEKATNQAVEVLQQKQIAYYEISVLRADDEQALNKWLNEHGYQFPANANYVLKDYIDQGWYFTAVKIEDQYLSQNLNRSISSGDLIPLSLKFTTDKLVFPLKISSVDYYSESGDKQSANFPARENAPYIGVLVYIIADQVYDYGNFQIQYADYLKRAELEQLASDDQGEPWLKPSQDQYVLTKLYKYLRQSEMTNDLYFKKADYQLTTSSKDKAGFTVFMIITGLGTLFLVGAIIYLYRKNN